MKNSILILAIYGAFILFGANSNVLAQSSYGPECDPEEVRLLLKSTFTDSEIRSHCSGRLRNNSSDTAIKYNWEVCRFSNKQCNPSNACVATSAEMAAIIKNNGHTKVWYMTGKQSKICGGRLRNNSSTAVIKYNWEVCRFSNKQCNPSNACVATSAEMAAIIKNNGHTKIWYMTGKQSRTC